MMQMTAAEAWAYLAANPNAQLVDVRTKLNGVLLGLPIWMRLTGSQC